MYDSKGCPIEEPSQPQQRHRSVSQLTGFTRCGESYRLERVARAPATPAAWFAMGTAFHTAAEQYELSEREMAPGAVEVVYLDAYDSAITEALTVEPDTSRWMTGGRVKGSDDISRRRERGLAQVAGYLDYVKTAPESILYADPFTPAVEHPFELDLDGLTVKGYIDQVIEWPGGIIGPRDLKTGSKRPDWAIQLAVYKLAIERDFAVTVSWGDFYMAKDNRPDPAVNLDRYTADYLTRLFHDMHRAEEAGIYLPNPGDACRTCGVAQFCTAVGGNPTAYPIGETE